MQRARKSQMNIKSDNVGLVVYQPPGSEKARLAAIAVVAAAIACGLTLKQAQELAAAQVEVAAAIVAHPEREAELRRKALMATETVVRAFRGPRSASASWGGKSVRASGRAA